MTMESLLNILPPPAAPRDVGNTEDWPEVEQRIGTVLPSDYKEYVNTFGTGRIGSLLLPYNPFSPNKHLNLIKQSSEVLQGLQFDDLMPYPLYPESGGVLPWGTTDNGDVLCWLTTKEPEEWGIAVLAIRDAMYERYDEDMTDFIAKLLSRDIVSKIFPNAFPGKDAPLFETIR